MTARTLCSSLILVAAFGRPVAGADTIITGTIQFTGGTCFSSVCSAVGLLPTAGSFTYDQSASQFTSFTVTYDGVIYDFVNNKTFAPANNPQLSGSEPCLSGATGAAATFALLTSCPGVWFANSSPGSSLFDFYLGSAVLTIAQSSTGPLPVSGGNYTVSVSQAGTKTSITVTPAALNFQTQPGAPAQSQSLQIGGTAGTAWQATAATLTGGAWLSVSPGAGQIPASLTALVNPVGLTAGTYQGSINVQASGATPPSSTISVSLTVTAPNWQGGTISTVAGNGNNGFSGDGGAATSASFVPEGVAVDTSGNLFIVDGGNGRIRKVSASGIITTVAGTGAGAPLSGGFSGDGGQATLASLNRPTGVAVDGSGNFFIADDYNNRIRKVSASGIITTVAGNGTQGFSGDGGPATSAALYYPGRVAVDVAGNLFIANFNRIRKVSASGIITTVAGNGTLGFSGDGGPATSASILVPWGVAVDASGNLFFADRDNNRIRKVSASGIITTVAGNGPSCPVTDCGGFSGDGGPATSASLNGPSDVAVDAAGNLFIADSGNNRIRKVSASGIITTFVGNGSFGFSGDGGPATSATLRSPTDVAVDASGNLFFSDIGNNRIREVFASAAGTAPSIASGGIVPVDSTVSTIQPGEWVSIYGTNLATSTASVNGNYPTTLNGTSVTINGKAGYLWFVSPTQINLQAPSDTATGPVPVVVTTPNGTATSTVTLAQFGPSFSLLDRKHVAGIILRSNGSGAYGGGTYDIIGPTGSSIGYPTVAAMAGDNISLFAVGLGPTNPMITAGQAFSGAAPTTYLVNLFINNVNVIPTFSGLTYQGLYQINLTVPAGLGTGDVSLVATVGGVQTPSGVVISVQPAPVAPRIQSLTLSPNSVASGGTVTGIVALTAAAPSGDALVTLSSSSSAASVPATVTVPAGATSATFTVSAGTVSSNQPVTITASYGGSSAQASLTVGPPSNSQCTNVSGNWNASESGSMSVTIIATVETDAFTDPLTGSGGVTITQTGCSIQYDPIGVSGLIGTNLTPSQLASLRRTGSVSGNSVSVTGLLALLDTVAAGQNGLTITNVSSNVVTASGQVAGNVMTLNETGTFAASGTYSISGQSGSFTLTITTSSIATFNWASGARPTSVSSVEIRVVPDQAPSSPVGQGGTQALVRAALKRALIFGNR